MMANESIKDRFVRKAKELAGDLGNGYLYFALKKINEQQLFFIEIPVRFSDFQPVGLVLEMAISELEEILFNEAQCPVNRMEMEDMIRTALYWVLSISNSPPGLTN